MQLILDLSAAKPCVPHKVLVAHPELANERADIQVCHTASPCQESVRAPHTTSLAVAPVCSHVPRHPVARPGLHLRCSSVAGRSTAPQGEESGSTFSHAPAGLAGFQPTAGQDGVCGRLQGAQLDAQQRIFYSISSNRSKRAQGKPQVPRTLTGTTSGSIMGRTELQA